MIRQVVLATIAILWGLPLYHSQGIMGPFEIEFQGYGLCPDVKMKNPTVFNTKFSKVGRQKYMISFDVNTRYPVSDDIKCKIEIAVKTQNGFKRNFFNMEAPLVSALKTYAPQYYKRVKWPVPPGNYSVKNLTIGDFQHALIPKFFYITFKMTNNMYMKNELLSCIEALGQIVPKKK